MSATLPPPEIPGLAFLDKLGSGGYADVYLYSQAMPARKVAVKVLREAGLSAGRAARFAAEANAMAQLEHPHIVPVYAAGTTGDGHPYLVMMFYPQASLAERARKERFSVAEVLRIGIQISSAVETAHRSGLLHRDIKPANILTSQYGTPGLTDFGIAAQVSEVDDDDAGVSVPWSPVETLYVTGPATVRSDVYSLAATLWHLLVGRSPFEVPGGDNSTYALMKRIRDVPAPSTGRSDVPTSLERLLRTALAKDAHVRPASALALARSLQAIEQELRLARTEIVLAEDAAAVPAPDDGTTRVTSPERPPRPGDDATRLRQPQRVEPQRVEPQRVESQRVATQQGAAQRVATQRAETLGGGTAPDDDPATLLRGGVVRSAQRAPEPDPDTAYRRPASHDHAALPDPADDGAGRRAAGFRWGLAALGAMALMVVAVVAFWAVGGNRLEAVGEPTATPSAPRPDLGQVARPGMPVVSGQRADQSVHFAWTYDNPLDSDTFLVQVRGEDAPRDVEVPEITLDAPTETCIAVKVLRVDGSHFTRDWPEETCA
ncbi:protein kinase [Propioniciclava soli]|uniref:Protein kinase n=1 Tax=Propioniciclava soli TaxID=2775081 RepID=A0ABZ3C4M9_9ACTN